MEHGPVDVIVAVSGEPKFDGSVLSELSRLASEGTIRVLDALLMIMDEDGEVIKLDIEDLPGELAESLGFIETGTRGLFDSEDADMFIEGMVPGCTVVALAIEHTWALGLRKALDESGGVLAMNIRIPAPVVDDAMSSLGAE